MALNTHSYETRSQASLLPRERTGGPRRGRFEDLDLLGLGSNFGSRMPLDTEPHWTWRNPLNIIPAAVLFVLAIALIGMIGSYL
jgi:hypothetical protein